MSRINDASLNQIGGAVQLYKYEPFSQFVKVSPTYSGTSLSFTASSPQLFSFLSNVDVSTIAFSSVNGPSISSSGLSLVVNAISNASTVETKTYTVNIGAGRFTNPPSNYPFVFYKNEPIGTNASSLFVSSIPNISKPVSTTSLPAGIGFVYNDICSYYLTGTPLITYPQSNYNIIASDASSRTINIPINIKVNPERVIMDNSGASTVTGAAIDTQITPLSVVGRAPPYTTGILSYTWSPSLPDGLRFTNTAGTTLTNGAVPTDASSTIILQGAITSAGIKTLSSANLNIRVTGTRTFTPTISSYVDLSVNFEESVVFDVPTVSGVYKDASFSYTSNYNTFRAYTLFADASITSMTASSLPTGVYLDFSSNAQRGYLVGTPTSLETCNATITATNANAKTRNLPVTISVSNDSITFNTFPSSSTFIVGRSLSNAKSGYYSSPLTFTATSGSGCNVTMSMTGLTGTGLSFTGTSGSTATYTLSGRPINVNALSSVTVSAEVTATSRTATSNYSFEIIPDAFTFSPDPSLVLIQNVPMTPVDIVATTLSELPVIQYISANIPSGISIGANGRISGTPTTSDTSGTFTILATTGPTSALSPTYTFTSTPDSIIMFAPQSSYVFEGGDAVSIPVTAIAYSGNTVSNYQLLGFPTSGLSIGSSSGVISGTLTDSIPPNPVLPSGTTSFNVQGSVISKNGQLPGTFTTTNPVVNRTYAFGNNINITDVSGGVFIGNVFTNDTGVYTTGWAENVTYEGGNQFGFYPNQVSDFKIKNSNVDGNVLMATNTGYVTPQLFRSTTGKNFEGISFSESVFLSSIVNKTDTSSWFVSGIDIDVSSSGLYLKRSDDDGLSWYDVGLIQRAKTVKRRDAGVDSVLNWYLNAGSTLSYKNEILMVGGNGNDGSPSMLRSTDDGEIWNLVSGDSLSKEVAKIYVDGSSRWIAVGSVLNQTGIAFSSSSPTIIYSDNNGSSWTNADLIDGSYSDSSGSFNYIAYDVVYGGGVWVASGISYYTIISPEVTNKYSTELRVSSNGSNWRKIHNLGATIDDIIDPQFPIYPYTQIGPIFYSSNTWNILIHEKDPSGLSWIPSIYRHSQGGVNDLLSNWTRVSTSLPIISALGGVNYSNIPNYRGFTEPFYIRTGDPTQATITFENISPSGPAFTAPTSRNFLFYQYLSITPITFAATGTGRTYILLDSTTLPPGLTWNPVTATVSGKSAQLGKNSFTVYAKDDNGVTSTVVQIETIIPRVIRQQTSAGAYTYLLKQYTEVLGAQASRDKKALPDEDSTLGKFMAPPAPDVMSASNTCGCPTK